MSPATTDLIFRIASTAALLLTAASPVAIALIAHWRRPKTTTGAPPPAPTSTPSVADTGALQGMSLQFAEGWQDMAEELRGQLTTERHLNGELREQLMVALAERDVARAERDLAAGALRARDLQVPGLRPPGHTGA